VAAAAVRSAARAAGYWDPERVAALKRELAEAKQAAETAASRPRPPVAGEVGPIQGMEEEMDDDVVEVSEPSIDNLLRDISVLEIIADPDGSLQRVIAARRERVEQLRAEKRAAKPIWQVLRDLRQRLARKEKAYDALQINRAKLASQIAKLRGEEESLERDATNLGAEVAGLKAEIAASAAREATQPGVGDSPCLAADLARILANHGIGQAPGATIVQAVGAILAQQAGAAATWTAAPPPPLGRTAQSESPGRSLRRGRRRSRSRHSSASTGDADDSDSEGQEELRARDRERKLRAAASRPGQAKMDAFLRRPQRRGSGPAAAADAAHAGPGAHAADPGARPSA